MSVEQEILVTGIKVVDLLAPYAKGGKIGEDLCEIFHFYLLVYKSMLATDVAFDNMPMLIL